MSGSGSIETIEGDGNGTAALTVGPVRLSLTGDFGTGTATLQAETPSGAYVAVDGGAFTDVTDTIFDFPENSRNKLRIVVSGSTNPELVVWIQSTNIIV